MNNQVATQQQGNSTAIAPVDRFKINLERITPTVMALLPAHVSLDHFKAMAVTVVSYNEKLLECTPASLVRAICELADLGLSGNPKMKEADILPRWSGKLKANEAHAEPRYEGLMKLARQSGEIIDIYAHEVCENDDFSYSLGLNKTLHHIPAMGERGAITYGYVVWTLKDGTKGFEVVDRKRIDRSRNASESYKAHKAGKLSENFVTWITDEGEMVRKTAVRAGSKYMPKSTESDKFRRALALADIDTREVEDVPEEAAQIAPPRPTRESVKRESEAQRKDAVRQDREFRERMREDDAAPRQQPQQQAREDDDHRTQETVIHDAETGEVTDDAEKEPQRETEGQATPAPQAAQTQQPAQKPAVDHRKIADLLLDKIERTSRRTALEGMVNSHTDDLEVMRRDAPDVWEEVQTKLKAKRDWFSKP